MDSIVHRIQVALQLFKQNIDSEHMHIIESKITKQQMFMLYVIRKYGKCKLNQLAEKLEVKPSAITVMIDRLENAGYVTRSPDADDRRSILVDLTPLGNDVLERAFQERNKILERYLSKLEQDELIKFAELMEKLVKD